MPIIDPKLSSDTSFFFHTTKYDNLRKVCMSNQEIITVVLMLILLDAKLKNPHIY